MNPPFPSDRELPQHFPPLPATVVSLQATVENPESSFEDIASAIETDAELSSRLLRLANSKFYDYPIGVSNIPDALSVVGLRNIRNLSLALLLPNLLSCGSGFPVDSAAFWRHSIAVGLCARLMALECREANTERHFIAGFFHKIGRLLIARIRPKEARSLFEIAQTEDVHLSSLLRSHVGVEEAYVAALCMRRWGFPSNIENLVRHHSKPVLARQNIRGVSIVHIANFVVSALSIGASGDRFVPEFSEAAWGYAAFEYSKLPIVVNELLRQLDDVCSVFLNAEN